MGLFDRVFTRKNNIIDCDNALQPNSDYLSQAEQISNIVSVGVEEENYTSLNQQLSKFVPISEEKTKYIFDHPRIESNIIAVIVCALFSLLYVYFILIGIGTSIFSKNHLLYGIIGIAVSAVLLLVNVILISKLVSTIKYKNRYDTYIEVLRFKSFEIVEDLSAYSKQSANRVIKDLSGSIKHKLIPQGHFTRENLVFMISNEIYDQYSEKKAVYDRYFKNLIEERNRMKERTEEINLILEAGTKYVEKIHDSNELIKDKSVTQKLSRMETIVSMIFHELDVNPSQASSLGVFLNYYLPTTEKLIEAYLSIGEKQITGKALSNTKKEIENSLDTIIVAFENILEKMYQEHEMDITSDIAAMEIIMQQEGLTE